MSRDAGNTKASNEPITPTGRVRAVQHPFDAWLFHPLAARLAQSLSHTPVTPNMVSLAGGLAIVAAGYLYLQASGPLFILFGFLVHASWHVLDGADGDLARLTGKSSPSGEIFDGICDYFGHIILYLTLAYALSSELGWGALAMAVAAGASRILQANFYESQRRQYMQWVHGVAWLRTSKHEPDARKRSPLVDQYLKLADFIAPSAPEIDRAMADPHKAGRLKEKIEQAGAKSLYGSSWLGAPHRTLALGIAIFAGSPVWFFLFETIVLNVIFVVSILRARHTLAELQQLAQD